ncbi:MAG: glycosyltransferase family 4 protein [Coriobacteriia bacterium]|nr:glycosyltransferase family 4 protein [Coriobacteriia bacterium]
MRIAMIGQRGIPATWGGIERHVDELSTRLVAMGHEVVVYTRPNYTDRALTEYKGVELRSLPTVGTKHLDAIVHCGLSTMAAWGDHFDIVHYHALGPTLVSPLARLRGYRVVATVHGRDWQREKWGFLARNALRAGEWTATHVPQATISVSETLADDYARAGRHVQFIPNGVAVPQTQDTSILHELGIAGEPYVLFAARIVPEKGPQYLIEAWRRLGRPFKLVIAGDTSFSDEFVAEIRRSEKEGVIFPGYAYGERLAALFRNAALFVLPSDLEGYPIVLLEALAFGTPPLASDIPQNIEVLGPDGTYFPAGDVDALAASLSDCMSRADELKRHTEGIREQAIEIHDWNLVAKRTVEVYEAVLGR